MDKFCKQILIKLNDVDGDPAGKYYDFQEDLDDLAKKLSVGTETLRSAINYLHDAGLIDYAKSQSGMVMGFRLNYRGVKHKEFSQEDRKNFWKQSVLTPVLVSLATTIVTSLLLPQLPVLLRWLLSLIQ